MRRTRARKKPGTQECGEATRGATACLFSESASARRNEGVAKDAILGAERVVNRGVILLRKPIAVPGPLPTPLLSIAARQLVPNDVGGVLAGPLQPNVLMAHFLCCRGFCHVAAVA